MPKRKKYKIHSSRIKLLMVIMYVLVITLFDVYAYGIIYQQKIQKENYRHPFWSWVFEESSKESGSEHITVPRYRVIQKVLEIGGIVLVFFYCGIWAAVGLIISHYLLTYDLLFYLLLNPGFINVMESSVKPYWLQNWYQIGYFILNPFNAANFYSAGLTGLVISLLCCYLPLKLKTNKI